jgi:DNA-binding MarR family transcriptional regulator
VLGAIARAAETAGDAVSQREIGRLVGLDEARVSRAVRELAARGLVDPGIAGGDDERSSRVFVTGKAEALLESARPAVEAAAEAFFRGM